MERPDHLFYLMLGSKELSCDFVNFQVAGCTNVVVNNKFSPGKTLSNILGCYGEGKLFPESANTVSGNMLQAEVEARDIQHAGAELSWRFCV